MKLKIWIGILGLGILTGLFTMFRVYTQGFALYAKTDVLVWTLPLATYLFFSLTSAGLAFVSSIPVVFGLNQYEPVKKETTCLELAVLLGSFVCLILHLGSPLNTVYYLLSPNPASPLWWMGILYSIYLVLLLIAFAQIHTGKTVFTLNVLIFLIAIATSTTLGWLMGMTDARPSLNASFLTIYFPLTAFVSGLAALLLVSLSNNYFANRQVAAKTSELYNDMAGLLGFATCIVLVMFLWRTVIGTTSSTAEGFLAFKQMTDSLPYNIELWIGLIIPAGMMLVPAVRKTTWGKIVASFFLLTGMLAGRLEFILSSELMPLGQMAEGRPLFVSYMPTLTEVLVSAFGLSVVLLAYTLGTRFLEPKAE